MELPAAFVDMIRSLLGEETEDFLRAMKKDPVVSIRKNPRKQSDVYSGERRVPWCDHGFYLSERPIFTLDPLLHAGAYYVQDASSMIHYEVVKRILNEFKKESPGPGPSFSVISLLDMCAAPGGKTTAMIDALPDGSRIVANEYVAKRAAVLKENLAKWGYSYATVTNHDSEWFVEKESGFDIVAVDAPCSGEGMMRKEPKAIEQWSPGLVEQCALLQKEILRNSTACIKPGGFLIYSTCTFNRQENEENASFLKDELGMIPYNPMFPKEWNIPRGIGTDLPVCRFMPHKTEGEGLFLAIFRKPGTFLPSKAFSIKTSSDMKPHPCKSGLSQPEANKGRGNRTTNRFNAKNPGIKGNVPEIEEILSADFDAGNFTRTELTESQAISYLRRESIVLGPDVEKGIVVVCYKGLPLGAVKNIGSRANNLYPKNWRILMR